MEKMEGSKPIQVIERVLATKDTTGTAKSVEGVDKGTVLTHWPNNDIWPFKVALPVVALAAGGMGFFINRAFRKALYLEQSAILSSYLATVGVPALSAGACHAGGVMYDILEQQTKCPVCVQVRGAAFQLFFGAVCPIIACPVVSYSTASMLKDVYLPKITKEPMEVLKFSKKVYSTIKVPLGWIAAAQVVVAMGMTYLEQECFYSTILPIFEGKKGFDLPKASVRDQVL